MCWATKMSKIILLLLMTITCASILPTSADYGNRTEIFGLAPEQQSEISSAMKDFLKKVLYDNSKEKDGFLVVYSNVATSDYKDYVTKVVMDTGNIVAVADSNKNRYKGTAVSNNILSSTINPKRWQCLIKFQVSVITYTF